MEKRALLAALAAPPKCSQHTVVLYQKSHTSCTESQKESVVLAVSMHGERQGAGLRHTDGNTWLRNHLENSNISGHVLVFTGIIYKKV